MGLNVQQQLAEVGAFDHQASTGHTRHRTAWISGAPPGSHRGCRSYSRPTGSRNCSLFITLLVLHRLPRSSRHSPDTPASSTVIPSGASCWLSCSMRYATRLRRACNALLILTDSGILPSPWSSPALLAKRLQFTRCEVRVERTLPGTHQSLDPARPRSGLSSPPPRPRTVYVRETTAQAGTGRPGTRPRCFDLVRPVIVRTPPPSVGTQNDPGSLHPLGCRSSECEAVTVTSSWRPRHLPERSATSARCRERAAHLTSLAYN